MAVGCGTTTTPPGDADGNADATGASDRVGSVNRALVHEASNIALAAKIPKSLNFHPNATRHVFTETAHPKRIE